MNYKSWNVDTDAPLLALKLCEEAAEVGTEISDALMGGKLVNRRKLHSELDHVEHLVKTLRQKFPAKKNLTK